ncbi:ferritin-like domain-containing protein [Halalkalicoccus subterraneus]|uniref:ferritin-like domain-containing protein n=1 Tax=Halalkalicoccus subterraneus TaxID=2675002 RepID=UPI000EFBC710|nr:ferritin-like domain-containing protein [Halalkalicoccus subterraneus]
MRDNDPTHDGTSSTSRRRFMAASALVGAGAFGLGGPVGSVAADEHDEQGMNEASEEMDGEFENDVDILNYARTLEFLEGEFYQEGLDNLGCSGLLKAELLADFGQPIRTRVFDDLGVIRDHEFAHADVLGETIEDLGGEPIGMPEFDFGTAVEDPDEFLLTAAILEDTGVGAYAGAAPSIRNAELVPPALSIHSVEARHASFLRVLGGDIGFAAAFDEALTREEVLERASPFIVE